MALLALAAATACCLGAGPAPAMPRVTTHAETTRAGFATPPLPRQYAERRFAPAGTVRVALQVRRRAGPQPLLRFATNGLTVRRGRGGRLYTKQRGQTLRLGRLRGRGRWIGLRLDLEAGRGRLIADSEGSRATGRLALRPETQVRVGPRRRKGRTTVRLVGVRVVSPPPQAPALSPPPPPTPPPDPRPFARSAVWNTPVSVGAPLDPRSGRYVDDLVRQIRAYGPWMNATRYSAPVYVVGPEQPRVRVVLDEAAAAAPELQQAWQSVPIPPSAEPAAGTDHHLVVWQPSTDTMWEFWLARRAADGWHARWGGRMAGVSLNPGYFTDPPRWGATATSLPLLGGLIRLDELRAGRIDHALALAVVETRAEWFSWPAQRTDGHVYRDDAIPAGTRFRLDPSLDLNTLSLSPLVRMIAEAAQRYGLIVRDKAGAVALYGEDPRPTGADPYHGPGGFYGGEYPNRLLETFPWDRLQVVRTDLACCWTR